MVFQDNTSVLSSMVKQSFFLDSLTFKDGTGILFCNINNQIPRYAAQCHRTAKAWTTCDGSLKSEVYFCQVLLYDQNSLPV